MQLCEIKQGFSAEEWQEIEEFVRFVRSRRKK